MNIFTKKALSSLFLGALLAPAIPIHAMLQPLNNASNYLYTQYHYRLSPFIQNLGDYWNHKRRTNQGTSELVDTGILLGLSIFTISSCAPPIIRSISEGQSSWSIIYTGLQICLLSFLCLLSGLTISDLKNDYTLTLDNLKQE